MLLPLRTTRYPLCRIRGVRVSVAVVGRGKSRRTRYVVSLSGIRDSTISSHGNPWFSRVLAEQLARRLRVPLINRVYGKSTRREPADLDRPLTERWLRDGLRFDAPRLPRGSRLREYADPDRFRLSIPAQMPALKFVSLGVLLLAIGAFAAAATGTGIAAFVGIGLFALLGGVMALALACRSTLTIGVDGVGLRQGWFPVKASMELNAIEELVVAADGITLIGDNNAIWIHWAGSREDSAYLEAVVPYQLQRFGSCATTRASRSTG